jgi:hypothetical protein
VRLELRPGAFLLQQRLEHVLDPVGGPERLLDPRAAALRRDDRELADSETPEAALVQRDRDAGCEERFADEEASPPSDLDDDAIRQR